MEESRIGLVLSGGGAKGAYQVGIVRALAEMGIPIAAIAGASIGALNGAVIASSPDLGTASERLDALWKRLAEDPPVGEGNPALLRFLDEAGWRVDPVFRYTAKLADEMAHNLLPSLRSKGDAPLLDNRKIRTLLCEYVDFDALMGGQRLFVSVFPKHDLLESLIEAGQAFLGVRENPDSQFLLVQSLAREDQEKALLGSSAIPLLLGAQKIGDEEYVDGGLGGVACSQGNTPIRPLLEEGYGPIIVTSLSDRRAWNRQQYPDADVLPVEREEPISRNLLLPQLFDVLSFHPDKIRSWIAQGYEDATRSVGPHRSRLAQSASGER